MNLANVPTSAEGRCLRLALILPWAAGCSMNKPVAQDLEKFQMAGPVEFEVDLAVLVRAKTPVGTYRVVPGNMLSARLPVLDPLSSSLVEGSSGVLLRRVGDDGNIWVPLHDKTDVLGKCLSEMENRIAKIGSSATSNTQGRYCKGFSSSYGIRTSQQVAASRESAWQAN